MCVCVNYLNSLFYIMKSLTFPNPALSGDILQVFSVGFFWVLVFVVFFGGWFLLFFEALKGVIKVLWNVNFCISLSPGWSGHMSGDFCWPEAPESAAMIQLMQMWLKQENIWHQRLIRSKPQTLQVPKVWQKPKTQFGSQQLLNVPAWSLTSSSIPQRVWFDEMFLLIPLNDLYITCTPSELGFFSTEGKRNYKGSPQWVT